MRVETRGTPKPETSHLLSQCTKVSNGCITPGHTSHCGTQKYHTTCTLASLSIFLSLYILNLFLPSFFSNFFCHSFFPSSLPPSPLPSPVLPHSLSPLPLSFNFPPSLSPSPPSTRRSYSFKKNSKSSRIR